MPQIVAHIAHTPKVQSMDIVVFGAGSLGSLLGGVLATEHSVTLVGREQHVEAIQSNGLRIDGESSCHVTPAATTDGAGLSGTLALVTVKSFDTDEAARTLATGTYDIVCSLQNGLGNEASLAAQLDTTVLAGTATYGARLTAPGIVECTGTGEIVVGARDGGHSPAAKRAGDAFAAVGLSITVADDMPRRLWEKLAVNAGINATTALARVPNGALVDGPAQPVAVNAAREAARVAQASGVDIAVEEVVTAVKTVADTTAANKSSMLQDVQAERQTEVEAINGVVADRGSKYGVETPVNDVLVGLLRAWEAENGTK